MRRHQGGKVIYPMTPIETARDDMKTLVAGLAPDGFTPLSETLFEVYRYWAGLSPRYADSAASTRVRGNGNFITPLGRKRAPRTTMCYLTDGEPTRDTDANTVSPAALRVRGHQSRIANPVLQQQQRWR